MTNVIFSDPIVTTVTKTVNIGPDDDSGGTVMRVSKERAAENRERIVTAAARLFRERGLSGVGVDALTQAAGLTHGSLYSQFGSKERLAAEALSHALAKTARRLGKARTLDEYVSRYLTPEHRDRLTSAGQVAGHEVAAAPQQRTDHRQDGAHGCPYPRSANRTSGSRRRPV